jgi:hypothetical protein
VVTNVPTWAVYLLGLGPPLLALLGVLIGHRITHRGALELEVRSRREEVMRNLRWAAELAVSDEEAHARLGVAELEALGRSDMLDDHQQLFIDAALEAVIRIPAREIEQLGEDVQVVARSPTAAPEVHVPSEPEANQREGDG